MSVAPAMACQEDLSSINAAEGKPTAMHQAQSRHELNHIVPHQVLWQMTCRMQQQESATSVTQISAHLPHRTLAHILAHLPPRTPAGAVLPCSLHPRGSHAQTQQLWRAMKSTHNTVTNTQSWHAVYQPLTVISKCLGGEHLSESD